MIRLPSFVLLLVFIVVPVIEIGVFLTVGGWIGIVPTLLGILVTAFVGAALVRRQGLNVLTRIQVELKAQRVPLVELFDGLCLLIAGLLLITPGFFTDAVGFALLVPPLRALLGLAIARRVQAQGGLRPGVSSGAYPFAGGTAGSRPFDHGGPGQGDPFGAGSSQQGPFGARRSGQTKNQTQARPGEGTIIDVDYEVIEEEDEKDMPPRPGPPRHDSKH